MKKLLLSFTGILCIGALAAQTYESQRPAPQDRFFVSEAVEQTIVKVQEMLTNSKLAWMFGNCFPNTLDTTVHFKDKGEDGLYDTSLIHI